MFDLNDRTTNGNQTKLTAKDFDQELLDLYDFYAHGQAQLNYPRKELVKYDVSQLWSS